MKHRWLLLAVALLIAGLVVSCEEEKVEPTNGGNNNDSQFNEPFYNLMNEWYYWYQEIPDIDPGNYDNPQEVLQAIRYSEDRWSYITSYDAFQQYYQEGRYIGYGFGSKWDDTDTLRLTFVFDDSPLTDEGVGRGWAITKVNGSGISPDQNINELLGANEVGVTNSFEFKSPSGDIVSGSFEKEDITMNTVMSDTVLTHSNKKVGYFMLKSFIETTPAELTDAFREFGNQNIDELVIDLRYNGGGTLSASRFLADFVIDDQYVGEDYVRISHNDKKAPSEDRTHVFEEDSLNLSLGLNRVYFITTQASASASEALINGLEPWMDVYLVGQDTYGKPVGMYAFSDNNKEYAFVPVCFSLENANGNANYFDGLPVDAAAADGVRYAFGDKQEASLNQVLYHISNGSFDQTKAGYPVMPANRVEYNSLRDEIGAH